MTDPDREASDRTVNGDSPPTSGSAIEGLLDAWWSRYCPTCKSRHPLSETVCPEDGSALRDLSITFSGLFGTTGMPDSTIDFLKERTGFHGAEQEGVARCQGSIADPGAGLPLVLGGKWRVGERKGGGTFGAFFEGQHHLLGMKVGIKVLHRRLNSTDTWRRLFHQEAMRVSRLNHPQIVKVLDYGEEEERPYLVMEYLTGKPLHHSIIHGGLSLDEGVEVMRQAAVALSAAHEGLGTGEPLVHLDLKPEHIFIEKIQGKWHVKVIDFGIAEIASAPSTDGNGGSSKPESKRVAGTLPYMAPERWNHVVDPRCDIYSLGIILYELVAGRKPFYAADLRVMRRLHEEEAPTPPSGHRSGPRSAALRELDSVILRCLEKDPGRRPQSAKVLVETIEAWQSRPRLSRGRRVLRAMAIPGLLLLLLPSLLYWAPWEWVEPRFPSGRVLGPKRAIEIEPVISGLGYEGYEAFLSVTPREPEQETREVSWKSVREGAYELSWENLRKAFPSLAGSHACEARLRVGGQFLRSVSSKPFEIALDDQPPEIASPGGPVEVLEENGRQILYMLGTELTFAANEPLDPRSCSLNDNPPRSASSDQQTVGFKVARAERRLEVVLVDLAGNTTEKRWDDVHWVDPPRLASEPRLFTNETNFELKLKVAGDCGRLTADGEDLSRPGAEEGSHSLYRKPLRFSEEDGHFQRKEIKFLLWSSLSHQKRREPDNEVTVTVEHLRRSLRIESVPASGDGFPESFRVLDAEGKEVAAADLVWEKPQLDIDNGREIRGVEARLELGADGKLEVKGLDSFRGSGRLILTVEAKDRYGNQARWRKPFPDYAQPSRILEIGLTEAGGDGSEEKPLLYAGCDLRKQKQNRSELSLTSKVDSQFMASLDFELRVKRAGAPDQSVDVKLEGGLCIFDQKKLLGLLQPGSNDVIFLASSRDSSGHKDSRAFTVYCAKPLDVRVLPNAKEAIEGDQISLETLQKGGPRIQGVQATSRGRTFQANSTRAQTWAIKVPIELVDWTDVELELRFEGGWTLRRSLRYSRAPEEGVLYTFRAGEAGDTNFEYERGDQPGGGFYFTRVDDWPEIHKRFRRSPKGQEFRNAPWSHTEGVSSEEASAIVQWFTEECQKSVPVLLGPDERFELPILIQLRSIKARLGSGLEWLRDVPKDELKGDFKAALAERKSTGDIKLEGSSSVKDLGVFRLVLRERSGSPWSPAAAKRAKKESTDGEPP